ATSGSPVVPVVAGETSPPTTNFGPLVIHQFLGSRPSSPRRLRIAPNTTTGLSLPKSKRHGNQLRRFTLERQQTCSGFTAMDRCCPGLILYAFCTMDGRCSAKTRRREHAAAVV